MLGVFITCILFVLFGQLTVRKLRKKPEVKDKLGIEFASGWDILNVASALCRPKWMDNRYKKSRLSGLAANAEVLYQHTTLFDRILARIFWYSYVMSGSGLILMLILNLLGVFD
ncbi:hypothetical protein J0A65_13215 [Bowmanella sp. Y57]|uniref:Uncharacterized protein n=2 Tax=Bowmanella yangjiangensis TaxID=2811230 RepID=A0ABS3CUP6_9ALTE|nr:hypothetical protein [Bowmanella yangjiangensis]